LEDFGFGSLGLGDVAVPFIDVDHLILNKRSSGRLQDLADADALAGGTAGTVP
jgi:hypothetical protein